MERDSLIEAMKTSISEVLETMFFCPVAFPETAKSAGWLPSDNSGIIATKQDFSGPISGSFFLVVPEKAALTLTAAFIGKDEESVSQDHVDETPKEIVNMIAGYTLTILDDLALFELGIPERVGFGEVGLSSGSEDAIVIGIDTPGGSLLIKLVNGS